MTEEDTMTLLVKIKLNNPKLPRRAAANVLKDMMPIVFHPHIEKVEITPDAQQAEP